MKHLSFEDLDRRSAEFDALVEVSPIADHFCSSTDWILPARKAFKADVEPRVLAYDEGWLALMRMETVLGRTLMPMESSWGLAAPLISSAPAALAARFLADARAHRADWDALFLSGITRGGTALNGLVHAGRRAFRLGIGQPTIRCVASLGGGLDGFLSRRTARFRKNMRRALRGAEGRIAFEWHADVGPDQADAVYARVIDVERRSWKAREGHGIDDGSMNTFYALMCRRLAERRALRVTFATEGDRTVGYVLGGVRGDTYRGLQISFDEDYREVSMGNLMQRYTVEQLCLEPNLHHYDLGTNMAYKRAWAERQVETVPLVVR